MSKHHFDWKPAFLESLRSMPIVRVACDVVGINRSTAWRAKETDEEFAKAWEEAMADGVDKAEAAAYARAVDGFEEPVIDKGRLAYRYERVVVKRQHAETGKEVEVEEYRPVLDANGQPVPLTVRKHSDALLSLILKGRRKEVYADRTELTGADGGAVAVDSGARAARIAQLMAAAKARKDDYTDLA